MNKSTGIRVTLNSKLLPLAIGALIVLQFTIPYQGWAALLIGLGGALAIGLYWVRALARGLSLSREIRFGWAQVGDQLEERFTLTNESWVPAPWIEVTDRSTLPGYSISAATGIDGRSTTHRTTRGICTQRGSFTLGPTTMRTGDPFGLCTVTIESRSAEKMLVLPPVVPLPEIEIAAGGRAREGRRHANSNEQTVSAISVREYAPGDSKNLIHWRTVARRDELYVRSLDSTPSGAWWIFLDLNRRVHAGQGADSSLEHSIVYAASLAARGLRDGRSVGLVANGDTLGWLAPREGEGQRWEILHQLALAQLGARPLADVLAHGPVRAKQISSLIVITPDLTAEWVKPLLKSIWSGSVATVLVLDAASFGGAGNVRPVTVLLGDLEIAHYVMTRDSLDRSEVSPVGQMRANWRVTPRGRAISTRTSRELMWRTLA